MEENYLSKDVESALHHAKNIKSKSKHFNLSEVENALIVLADELTHLKEENEKLRKGEFKHSYWRPGEKDCPADIKAPNGELHTLRCRVCGKDNPIGQCIQKLN